MLSNLSFSKNGKTLFGRVLHTAGVALYFQSSSGDQRPSGECGLQCEQVIINIQPELDSAALNETKVLFRSGHSKQVVQAIAEKVERSSGVSPSGVVSNTIVGLSSRRQMPMTATCASNMDEKSPAAVCSLPGAAVTGGQSVKATPGGHPDDGRRNAHRGDEHFNNR